MFVPSSSSKQRESDYSLAKSRGKMCNSRQVRIQRRRAMDLVIIWRIFWLQLACKLSNGITTAMTKYIWMCSTVQNKRLHIFLTVQVFIMPNGVRPPASAYHDLCIYVFALDIQTVWSSIQSTYSRMLPYVLVEPGIEPAALHGLGVP